MSPDPNWYAQWMMWSMIEWTVGIALSFGLSVLAWFVFSMQCRCGRSRQFRCKRPHVYARRFYCPFCDTGEPYQ